MTADKPLTQIDNIEIVDVVPSPEKRKPHTLYIPKNEGVATRNQFLGAFMDRWSGLERSMLMLLWPLSESDYAATEVLFYSTTNIKTQTDMIGGLVALKHKQQSSRCRELMKRCLELSNDRNRLVHGHWIPEYGVGGDEQDRPVVTRINWLGVYMTGDPDLNQRAAMQSGKPKTGKHRYPLERIRQKIEQVEQLSQDLETFRKKLFGEVLPLR